jgi:hypothetical protein
MNTPPFPSDSKLYLARNKVTNCVDALHKNGNNFLSFCIERADVKSTCVKDHKFSPSKSTPSIIVKKFFLTILLNVAPSLVIKRSESDNIFFASKKIFVDYYIRKIFGSGKEETISRALYLLEYDGLLKIRARYHVITKHADKNQDGCFHKPASEDEVSDPITFTYGHSVDLWRLGTILTQRKDASKISLGIIPVHPTIH